jgi:hypothetical protein
MQSHPFLKHPEWMIGIAAIVIWFASIAQAIVLT